MVDEEAEGPEEEAEVWLLVVEEEANVSGEGGYIVGVSEESGNDDEEREENCGRLEGTRDDDAEADDEDETAREEELFIIDEEAEEKAARPRGSTAGYGARCSPPRYGPTTAALLLPVGNNVNCGCCDC